MYLIGIKFGRYETTASYIDTKNPTEGVRRLILDDKASESSKVESSVWRDRITGEWKIGGIGGLSLNFKDSMTENKEALGAFVKLLLGNILKNHDFLYYDPVTGQKNFCIFASYPSDWTIDDIKYYKKFLSSIIPVEWVIKDSDAVYFTFKSENKLKDNRVLIIDVGTNTINFSTYESDGWQSFFGTKDHGASQLEICLLEYFRHNSKQFQVAEKEAKTFCKLNNINWENINWENSILLYLRIEKEDFYTEQQERLYLDLRNKRFSPGLREFIFDSEKIERAKLENEILSNYKKALQDDFEEVKAKAGRPKIVILAGGASRMPWLQRMVGDVFSESLIIWDTSPSYVVSDGLVYYAHENFK